MKRKFKNIEVVLPSRKRIKLQELTIETKTKMNLETEEELSTIFRNPKYPGNQQQYFKEREEQKK